MPGFRAFRRIWPRPVRTDVDEELSFHIAQREEALRGAGLTEQAAREQALREFGSVLDAQRELYAIDDRMARRRARGEWLSGLMRDVVLALRMMRRDAGLTIMLVTALALGIGANSAVFSVVRSALLEALPYDDPDRLVHVWETHAGAVDHRSEASYPDFEDWRVQTRAFQALEGYNATNVTVQVGGEARMVRGARVTPGFLTMLGVRAAQGRLFAPDTVADGAAAQVVVSDGFWQRRLGGAGGAVGTSLTIDGAGYTIVGVLPARFHFAPLEDAELWFVVHPSAELRAARYNHWLNVVGRLAAGADMAAAQTQLTVVMQRLALEYPDTNAGRGVDIVPLREEIIGDVRPLLLVLFSGVGLVLLIACANVASVLLARSVGRAREMAVRAALGAGRRRLVRQLLTESLLLSLAGGVVAVGVAALGTRLLVSAIPEGRRAGMPYLTDVGVDGAVLAYTAAIALATGVAFGLAPALYAARTQLMELMQRGGRNVMSGGRFRALDAVVAGEIAIALVLLVGAGLLGRSLAGLLSTDRGFDGDRVMTARVPLAGPRYVEPDAQRRFFEELLARVRQAPGVVATGAISNLPLVGGGTNTFAVEGYPAPAPSARPEAVMRGVAGDYFDALRIRSLSGRVFTPRDDTASLPVLVVNEALARRFITQGSALGARLRFHAFPDTTWEIVGVVADVKTTRLDEAAPPTVYYTHLQAAENRMTLAVRVRGATAPFADVIRRATAAMDPSLPVYQVTTMEELVTNSRAVFARRYPLLLIGFFALTALILAFIGVWGVIAFAVAQRRRELGVRLALGATPGALMRTVMRRSVVLAVAGIGAGLLGAAALTQGMRTMLFGIGTFDPVAYAGAAALLATAALGAGWLPVRRVARIQPTETLRG